MDKASYMLSSTKCTLGDDPYPGTSVHFITYVDVPLVPMKHSMR